MITKLLLTLAVIAVAWLVVRNRQRRMSAMTAEPRLSAPPRTPPSNVWRWGGYALGVVMILGSGLFLYMEWQDRYRVVTVSVVNTQTGERTDYQAHRMDVEARSFITLDGVEINVAATERIELKPAAVSVR